jgi:hypothetical protein
LQMRAPLPALACLGSCLGAISARASCTWREEDASLARNGVCRIRWWWWWKWRWWRWREGGGDMIMRVQISFHGVRHGSAKEIETANNDSYSRPPWKAAYTRVVSRVWSTASRGRGFGSLVQEKQLSTANSIPPIFDDSGSKNGDWRCIQGTFRAVHLRSARVGSRFLDLRRAGALADSEDRVGIAGHGL